MRRTAKNMKFNQNLKGSFILCLASLIWGFAFVVQSALADTVPPFLLNCLRSLISVVFLGGVLLIKKGKTKQPVFPKDKTERKRVLLGGLLCGLLLTLSVNLQQFGLMYYPEGAAAEARGGFLTSLYVVLVPVFFVFLGKKLRPQVVLAVVLAMGGIYLLCVSGSLGGIYLGDVFVLLCALSFTFHILMIDRFGNHVDGILLSAMQFFVCGALSGVLSFCFEDVVWGLIPTAIPQLLYMGVLSSGVGYTLQIVGQKYAEPTVASLSMSLESVFAALGGWLVAGNVLSLRELGGCALVFAAIVLAQLPQFKKKL